LPLLRFKKVFHAAIRQGTKTTTLRRWDRPMLRAGTCATVPGVGSLFIDQVESVKWDALGEADAKADGFDSMAELQAVVRKIYPNADRDGKKWFRVHFRLAESAAPPKRGKTSKRPPRRVKSGRRTDRARLAAALLAELDKAVGQTGS
jgi:hypothetical protein